MSKKDKECTCEHCGCGKKEKKEEKFKFKCSFCKEDTPVGECQILRMGEDNPFEYICDNCAYVLEGCYIEFCGNCRASVAIKWDCVIDRTIHPENKAKLSAHREIYKKLKRPFIRVFYGCAVCQPKTHARKK